MHRRLITAATAIAVVLGGAAIALVARPADAATATYQAESAALSGGAVTATDHTGYTGSGFVGGYTDGNKGNAATTFTVQAGNQLALRYANGTGSAKTLSLYVGGVRLRQITLAATANWDTWGTATESVSLTGSSNTVAYRFDSADSGNVNLDSLTVSSAASSGLEAENAVLSGGASVATDHSGYTGTGFVGGYTDGNKGNASTTFTVPATSSLTLRYANGTGSSRTLSLYVNGARLRQISLPATANWDTWGTATESVSLTGSSNTVAYRFDATDSGNVNLDNLSVGAAASPSPSTSPSASTSPPPTGSGRSYEAEAAFFSSGPSVASSTGGYSGTGYLTGFTGVGARVIATVNAPAAGARQVGLRYGNASGAARTLSQYVNGIKIGQVSLPAGSGWLTATQTVTLRAGVNLIGWQVDSGDNGGVNVDVITVDGGLALAARGATMPYTEYRAADASTNGSKLAASRTYLTMASEATGRSAVQLTATGQYVQFTLSKPANALTIRYSIPDSGDGAGASAPISLYANGTHVKDITLTSRYSWVYGAYPYTNVPSQGSAHHFFDETRATIGDFPAGTVLKLQKDAGDTASSYTIDVVDAEQVAAAFAMPANFVSITSSGATSGDGSDDTAAINNAIASARAAGKGVWIPAGTFDITGRVNVQGVAVRGAGQWYSTLKGRNGKGGFFATGSGVTIADLTVSGDVTYRDDTNFDTGIEGNFGTGSLLFDVRIEHTKTGMWISAGTDGLYAAAIRIANTFADGVNLNSRDGVVQNTRIDQSAVRNTGDDALAMFSQTNPVTNSKYTFNTVQTPLLANAVGIYGGSGNVVSDNLLSDTVTGASGIAISSRFGIPFSGPTTASRNTLTRTGGYEPNWASNLGALWIYADQSDITTPVTVTDTTILDSTYQAVLLSYGHRIGNLLLDHVTISGAGTWGIDVYNVTGALTANYVTVTGAASGGLNNPGGFSITRGPGNSGW
ncbi:CBM35 domain-containing protein [Dactylosporangium sp. CS-033363]|uniref:CBM35 domain-containing protein n=1 Tax=Dactylosporangium sp. CS-033363 TaxID=3239935 RepID=UPI003D92767D